VVEFDLLATVLDGLDQGLVAYDRNLRIVAANARAYEILELPQDGFGVGTQFEEWIRYTAIHHGGYIDSGATVEERINKRINIANNFILFTSDNKRPDGKVIEIKGKSYKDIYITTYTDITGRKATEERLRDSEERFRDMAASALDRFWETDENFRYIYLNEPVNPELVPRTQDMLGKTRWEMVGINPQEHLNWRAHLKTLEAREPFRDFIYSMAGSDGIMRFFSTSGKPTFDLDGNFTGYRGTSTDVTRKEELARLKREFISTASHELRTPLTSIRGALGLIAANAVGEIPESASELISIAERNCNRLLLLVNDILDMDKIESGAMAYHFERLQLNEAIRKAIEANRAFGDEFGVSFKLTPSPVDGWVEADEERLNQIIANLLSNAAKFSPMGSNVDIFVESLGTIFRISVRDEGPGIAEGFRDQISKNLLKPTDRTRNRRVVPVWD